MQERAQNLQYAHALQYISYCNDVRYKDRWAPVVKHFWAEVVKLFRSWTLCNLDPSHLLGTVMHPNQGAKIPDYGVHKHIAFVCAPFFEGIKSQSQYEKEEAEMGGVLTYPDGCGGPLNFLLQSRQKDPGVG